MTSVGSDSVFHKDFFPLKLLRRFLDSTPDERTFIGNFFWRKPAPATPGGEPKLTTESPGPGQYSLHREGVCWVLRKDGIVYLKPEIGLNYVAWLLAHPDERPAAIEMFCRFSGRGRKHLGLSELPDPETNELSPLTESVALDQLNGDEEDERARVTYYAKLHEYQQAAANPALPESRRREARRLEEELAAFLKEHYRPVEVAGRVMVRRVHKSIQRLCNHLGAPLPGATAPNPLALWFEDYIGTNILVPSRRYTAARAGASVRLARGELAGRLVFECPPGDHWSVRF